MKWFAKLYRSSALPNIHNSRNEASNSRAIILIHGFTARADKTWAAFCSSVLADATFDKFNIFWVQYETNLRADFMYFKTEPNIRGLAGALATRLAMDPLARYHEVVLIGHSMGGLVVQEALLHPEVRVRVSHVVCLATPCFGVDAAGVLSWFKRQLSDLAANGAYVTELRRTWAKLAAKLSNIQYLCIVGNADEIVSLESATLPLVNSRVEVVDADHGSILEERALVQVTTIIRSFINNIEVGAAIIGDARMNLEIRDYRKVVEALFDQHNDLDEAATINLLLALDALRNDLGSKQVCDAARARGIALSDLHGVIGGRLKREWLTTRVQDDLDRAVHHYHAGLRDAREKNDTEQIFYMAINIAFLQFMSAAPFSQIDISVEEHLKIAEEAAGSNSGFWADATRAEIALLRQEGDKAIELYEQALGKAHSFRQIRTLLLHALQICEQRKDTHFGGQLGNLLGAGCMEFN